MKKTTIQLKQEQERLEQRLLAIPGLELVVSFDPADLATSTTLSASPVPSPAQERGKRIPPRRWLFEKAWLGFSLGHDQGDAWCKFEKQFGHSPEFVYQDFKSRVLWVGPV